MDVDYAGQSVVVEMEHGSFVFTPIPCDLLSSYGGKLRTPVEMREPRVKVHGMFPVRGVSGNISVNGVASLRHYGVDCYVWIDRELTFTRDSGVTLPAGQRYKSAWMEVVCALKAFQTQVPDWETRCMALSVHAETMYLGMEAERLSATVREMNRAIDDLAEYRRDL